MIGLITSIMSRSVTGAPLRADGDFDQHQRADDHDRRKGRRNHPGGSAAETARLSLGVIVTAPREIGARTGTGLLANQWTRWPCRNSLFSKAPCLVLLEILAQPQLWLGRGCYCANHSSGSRVIR